MSLCVRWIYIMWVFSFHVPSVPVPDLMVGDLCSSMHCKYLHYNMYIFGDFSILWTWRSGSVFPNLNWGEAPMLHEKNVPEHICHKQYEYWNNDLISVYFHALLPITSIVWSSSLPKFDMSRLAVEMWRLAPWIQHHIWLLLSDWWAGLWAACNTPPWSSLLNQRRVLLSEEPFLPKFIRSAKDMMKFPWKQKKPNNNCTGAVLSEPWDTSLKRPRLSMLLQTGNYLANDLFGYAWSNSADKLPKVLDIQGGRGCNVLRKPFCKSFNSFFLCFWGHVCSNETDFVR